MVKRRIGFAEFLEMQMKAQQIGVNEFARRIGVGHSTISKHLKNRDVVPSIQLILKLSSETGTNLQTLLAIAYPEVADLVPLDPVDIMLIPTDRLVSVDGRVLCAVGELLSVLGGPVEDKPPVVKRRLIDALNIRSGPDVTSPKLGVLPAGTLIGVLDKVIGGYYKIAEQPGYIAANPAWSEVYTPPVVVVPPAPVKVGNKIGFHLLPGSYDLLNMLTRLREAGKPLAGLTLTRMGWNSELKPWQIKKLSPQTLLCQRWYDAEWERRAVDWNKADLSNAGYVWVSEYVQRFNVRTDPVDYHQVINEPGFGQGTASFWMGAMDAARQVGIKLALGCFAVGNPPLPSESPFWAALYPMLTRARAEGHALMLHEYTIPDGDPNWLNEWVMHRYLKVYAAFPPELKELPLILGEYGQLGLAGKSSEYLIGKLNQVQPILSDSPQVLFASLWTLGGGGAWGSDLVDGHLSAIEAYCAQA